MTTGQCSSPVQQVTRQGDRVLLKEVSSITLEKEKMTTRRRSSPVQQVTIKTCTVVNSIMYSDLLGQAYSRNNLAIRSL